MINSLIIFSIGCVLSLVIHITVFLYITYYFNKYELCVIDKPIIIKFLILTGCSYLGIIGIVLFYYDMIIYVHKRNKMNKQLIKKIIV